MQFASHSSLGRNGFATRLIARNGGVDSLLHRAEEGNSAAAVGVRLPAAAAFPPLLPPRRMDESSGESRFLRVGHSKEAFFAQSEQRSASEIGIYARRARSSLSSWFGLSLEASAL